MSDEIKILTPSGEEIESEKDKQFHNRRKEERRKEDKDYLPVIVKRTDESFRHPDDILEKAISEGEEQMSRPCISLFLSATAAGLIISFTVMAVAIFTTMTVDLSNTIIQRVLTALVYPLGFVLCILSRTQLFTEHTATAVYPILVGKFSVKKLFLLWFIVISGNLFGGLMSSQLLVQADSVIHAYAGYVKIAEHLVAYDSKSLLISAILAGWLMALAAWITLSTPSTLSQIVIIYLVTFLIGIGGLHHSIAGSVEMFVGYFISDNFSVTDVGFFVSHALLGNLIGGSIFVALLNYGHIRQTQKND